MCDVTWRCLARPFSRHGNERDEMGRKRAASHAGRRRLTSLRDRARRRGILMGHLMVTHRTRRTQRDSWPLLRKSRPAFLIAWEAVSTACGTDLYAPDVTSNLLVCSIAALAGVTCWLFGGDVSIACSAAGFCAGCGRAQSHRPSKVTQVVFSFWHRSVRCLLSIRFV